MLILLMLACKGPDDSDPIDTDAAADTDDTDLADTDDTDLAAIDADRDGSPVDEDCDDTAPNVFPGAPEACDDVDSDCSGGPDVNLVDLRQQTYTTIAAALADATDGDVVEICAGTYPEHLVVEGGITLLGASDQPLPVLTGDGVHDSIITTGTGLITVIGLAFQNGDSADAGGAIDARNADDLWVVDSTFTQNSAVRGGAIRGPLAGDLVVQRSTFTRNTAALGGSIYAGAGSIDADISEGQAEFGGAVYHDVGELDLGDSTIHDNEADYGGAIATGGEGSIAGGLVHHNVAASGGGGFYTSDQHGGLQNMSFTDNSVIGAGPGGAIYADSDADLVLSGVIVSGNEGYYGGGIYTSGGPMVLETCGVLDNVATEGGGLMIDGFGEVVVFDSRLDGNTPEDIRSAAGAASYTYGASVSVTCDATGCR